MTTVVTTDVTLELDDKLRIVLQNVVWIKIIEDGEDAWKNDDLPVVPLYALDEQSAAILARRAKTIGAWGNALKTVIDPDATSVTLPLEPDELRAAVRDFVKGAQENLDEVSLEKAHDALDIALYAKRFLAGHPVGENEIGGAA